MPDHHRPLERLGKPSLVTVSHAIERAALASAEDGPMVVFGLFQRMPYFERERAVYTRIAELAAVTVVGLVEEVPTQPVAGCHVVPLDAWEPLAREWTVAVLTPRFGAALVAHDRQEVDPQASTLESGRLFDGWWSFRRDDALHEVIRLHGTLADRLTAETRSSVDRVLDRVRDLPSAPGEARVDASVRLLVERAERRHRRTRALRRRLATGSADQATRLSTELAMRRWAGAEGTTASGTLPVALIGVRTVEPTELPQQWERRGAVRKTQSVVAAVTAVLRPTDRAVRLAEDEFLLIMPSLSEEGAVTVAYQVAEGLANLAQRYPFVPVAAHSVVTVTRRRPLPVDQIRAGLDWAVREQVTVATLPPEATETPAGSLPVGNGTR